MRFKAKYSLSPVNGTLDTITLTKVNELIATLNGQPPKDVFKRSIGVGSVGADVRKLQEILDQEPGITYPPRTITGTFGAATKAALIQFQAKYQIRGETGRVLPKTLALLNQMANNGAGNATAVEATIQSSGSLSINLTVGIKHASVKTLQEFLNRNGFVVATSGAGSPGKESTTFGPATTRAVMKFQQAYNIKPVSGFVGTLTRAKINELIAAGK